MVLHDIIKKGRVNLLKEQLTANEIRYRTYFPELTEKNFNPMNDVLFKFIFGRPERKLITIDFLNAIAAEDLGHPITDIVFTPTENVPDNYDEKLTRLDVACTLDTGEQVDIEVQIVNQKNMQRRTMCYWARLYLLSLPPGGAYQDLKPCITINLLRFNLLPQEEAHSMWSIYNAETGDRLNKDLVFHFLEIPKYTKSPKKRISDMTKMERWLAYFANQLSYDEKGELIMSDEAIHKAVDAARTFLQNDAERLAYINRELAILDYNSDHRDAFEEGKAEGCREGEAKGRKEGEAKGREEGQAIADERWGTLMQRLLGEQRYDDANKAAADAGFREKLFKEYGI